MEKTTLKELRRLIAVGAAIDVTKWGYKEAATIGKVEHVAYSRGVYGVNGLLVRGNDGKLYATTARTAATFVLL